MNLKMKHDSTTNAATIAATGLLSLCVPIWPAIVGMAAKPCSIILPAGISGFTLPFQSAFHRAEWVFLSFARLAEMDLAAFVALGLNLWNRLNMIAASRPKEASPSRSTL